MLAIIAAYAGTCVFLSSSAAAGTDVKWVKVSKRIYRMTLGPDGNLYATTGLGIIRVTPSGALSLPVPDTRLPDPVAPALDTEGSVFSTRWDEEDDGRGALSKTSPGGASVTLGLTDPEPFEVAVAKGGNVFVGSNATEEATIMRFSPGAPPERVLISSTQAAYGGSGCLYEQRCLFASPREGNAYFSAVDEYGAINDLFRLTPTGGTTRIWGRDAAYTRSNLVMNSTSGHFYFIGTFGNNSQKLFRSTLDGQITTVASFPPDSEIDEIIPYASDKLYVRRTVFGAEGPAVARGIYDVRGQGSAPLVACLPADSERDESADAAGNIYFSTEAIDADSEEEFGYIGRATPNDKLRSCLPPDEKPKAPNAKIRVSRRTVTASFTPESGVEYAMRARKGSRTLKGKCRAVRTGTTTSCSVRLTKGTWRISVTPSRSGLVGDQFNKSVRVR